MAWEGRESMPPGAYALISPQEHACPREKSLLLATKAAQIALLSFWYGLAAFGFRHAPNSLLYSQLPIDFLRLSSLRGMHLKRFVRAARTSA
jgi:hypothetical protein